VPTILALIRELAGFEHALPSVLATEASLAATLSFPAGPAAPLPDDRAAAPAAVEFTPGFARTLLVTVPAAAAAGSPPAAAAAAAEEETRGAEEEVAAMALFFANYSTWRAAAGVYLEDLYVRPAHRRRGHATALLRALAREALRAGGAAARLDWACLRWNEGALRAYGAAGAEHLDEWVALRVEGDRLKALAARELPASETGDLETEPGLSTESYVES
jgi:GNAT superfamily N-acetyltransferase